MRLRFALLFGALVLAACGPYEDDPSLGTATEAITCPTGATLQGADVSHYQGTIAWPSVGVSFAVAKATEGTGYTDPDFAKNWSGMKAAGVVRGAYHYIHCDIDPTQQAQYFLGVLSSAGGLQAGDLPPAL